MDTVPHTPLLKSRGEPQTVQALQPVPGLFVYKLPAALRFPDELWHWRVGHHSGLVIAEAEHAEAAHEVARAIADFTDWTRSAEELQADAGLDLNALYERINYGTPGVFLHKRPAAADVEASQ